jgi:hypothetical protein
MSEGERRKLELRLAAARRLASSSLDDLTKERQMLIRDLEKKAGLGHSEPGQKRGK